MAFCTNCGLRLNESSVFCPNCGTKIFRPDTAEASVNACVEQNNAFESFDMPGAGNSDTVLLDKTESTPEQISGSVQSEDDSFFQSEKTVAFGGFEAMSANVMPTSPLNTDDADTAETTVLAQDYEPAAADAAASLSAHDEYSERDTSTPESYSAPAQDRQEYDYEKCDVVGVGYYFLYSILYFIPFIGFILSIVMSFGGTSNASKKNFARTWLIFKFIAIILIISAAISLIILAEQLFALINDTLDTNIQSWSELFSQISTFI